MTALVVSSCSSTQLESGQDLALAGGGYYGARQLGADEGVSAAAGLLAYGVSKVGNKRRAELEKLKVDQAREQGKQAVMLDSFGSRRKGLLVLLLRTLQFVKPCKQVLLGHETTATLRDLKGRAVEGPLCTGSHSSGNLLLLSAGGGGHRRTRRRRRSCRHCGRHGGLSLLRLISGCSVRYRCARGGYDVTTSADRSR